MFAVEKVALPHPPPLVNEKKYSDNKAVKIFGFGSFLKYCCCCMIKKYLLL